MGIFPNATVFDFVQYQKGPIGGETEEYLPDTDVQIIKTPGHTADHASLLVPTNEGKVLIAADVFWWPEGIEQKVDINTPDEFASEFIIPDHGQPFKVPIPPPG